MNPSEPVTSAAFFIREANRSCLLLIAGPGQPLILLWIACSFGFRKYSRSLSPTEDGTREVKDSRANRFVLPFLFLSVHSGEAF